MLCVKPWFTNIFQHIGYIRDHQSNKIDFSPQLASEGQCTHASNGRPRDKIVSPVQCDHPVSFQHWCIVSPALRSSLWQHCFTTLKFSLTHLWPRTCNSSIPSYYFYSACCAVAKRYRVQRSLLSRFVASRLRIPIKLLDPPTRRGEATPATSCKRPGRHENHMPNRILLMKGLL